MSLDYQAYYCRTIVAPINDKTKRLTISLSLNEAIADENEKSRYKKGWPDVFAAQNPISFFGHKIEEYYGSFCSSMRIISAIYKKSMCEINLWEFNTDIIDIRMAEISNMVAFRLSLQSFFGGSIFTSTLFEDKPNNFFNEVIVVEHVIKLIDSDINIFAHNKLISMQDSIRERRNQIGSKIP